MVLYLVPYWRRPTRVLPYVVWRIAWPTEYGGGHGYKHLDTRAYRRTDCPLGRGDHHRRDRPPHRRHQERGDRQGAPPWAGAAGDHGQAGATPKRVRVH